ncbi:MAG: hypothetical protein HYV14_00335 [Elusimicrobia bacterium]|nr:hypothetical protein [Elusimicrobiota bacterium]
MTPQHLRRLQAELVQKLAKRASTRGKNDSLAFLDDAEIEAMIWDYPNDASKPLVLFALMTHPKSPGYKILRDEFDAWLSACSTRLCLEWLKRKGAIIRYKIVEHGASWQTNPFMLTKGFVERLKEQHRALHRFASYVLRDALKTVSAYRAHEN